MKWLSQMRGAIARLVAVTIVAATVLMQTRALASPTLYTDPTAFSAAISGLKPPTIIDFEDIDASPVNNTFNGRPLFDGAYYASQGITFSNPDGDPLYVAPGGLFWNASNSLSVGRFPFDPYSPIWSADDDLVVSLNSGALAVGLTLVDSDPPGDGEFVQFLDSAGDTILQVPLPANDISYCAFIGIVSLDRPVTAINIMESDSDTDDITFDDIIFVQGAALLPVHIDIKPGSYPNSFNVNGHGVIPVAILGSEGFDVTLIDPSTLKFSGLEVRIKGNGEPHCSIKDVSGDFSMGPQGAPDGDDDLVCQFVDDATAWEPGDSIAAITGNLYDGTAIEGSDEINIVPADK